MKLKFISFAFLIGVCLSLVFTAVSAAAGSTKPIHSAAALDHIIDIDYFQDRYNVALQDDGTIWYWKGNDPALKGPRVIGAVKVTAGNLVLKKDGTVWQWDTDSLSVTQVPNLQHIVDLKSGNQHVALDKDGVTWAWGGGCVTAQLIGSKDTLELCSSPTSDDSYRAQETLKIPARAVDGVQAIDVKNDVVLLMKDGSIVQYDHRNNIHYGSERSRLPGKNKPHSVSVGLTDYRGALFALSANGRVWQPYPENSEQLPSSVPFTAISANTYETSLLVLDAKGEVWGWVLTNSGKAPFVKLAGLKEIKQIKAREFNSGLALDRSGRVWSWGRGERESSDSKLNVNPSVSLVRKAVEIQWNGKLLPLSDAPVMSGTSVLVPIRDILKAFGAEADYDKGHMTIRHNDHVIEMEVYRHAAVVDGVKKEMDEAPKYVRSKTYVPLVFLSEALGASLTWDQGGLTVNINYE